MNGVIKIFQALEGSNLLLKGVTKTILNGTKEQKGGFPSMLLGTLRPRLLGNLLSGKGIVRAGSVYKEEKELKELVMEIKWIFNVAHPLTNFEIQNYDENEPRFNGVFSSRHMPEKMKDGAYIINPDEYSEVGTH